MTIYIYIIKEDIAVKHVATNKALSVIRNKLKVIGGGIKKGEKHESRSPKGFAPKTHPQTVPMPSRPPTPPTAPSRPPTPPTATSQKSTGGRGSQSRSKRTKYQMKPRVLLVGDSIAHNLYFRNIEEITSTTMKTAKAYSTVKDQKARFPNKNMRNVTKTELLPKLK